MLFRKGTSAVGGSGAAGRGGSRFSSLAPFAGGRIAFFAVGGLLVAMFLLLTLVAATKLASDGGGGNSFASSSVPSSLSSGGSDSRAAHVIVEPPARQPEEQAAKRLRQYESELNDVRDRIASANTELSRLAKQHDALELRVATQSKEISALRVSTRKAQAELNERQNQQHGEIERITNNQAAGSGNDDDARQVVVAEPAVPSSSRRQLGASSASSSARSQQDGDGAGADDAYSELAETASKARRARRRDKKRGKHAPPAAEPPAPTTAHPLLRPFVADGGASNSDRAAGLVLVCHTRPAPVPQQPAAVTSTVRIPSSTTVDPALTVITSAMYTTREALDAVRHQADDPANTGSDEAAFGGVVGDDCLRAVASQSQLARDPTLTLVDRALQRRAALRAALNRRRTKGGQELPSEPELPFVQSETPFRRLVQLGGIVETTAHSGPRAPAASPVSRVVPAAARVAACADPRFPLRLPLATLPFGLSELDGGLPQAVLPCYGSSDVVCDTIRAEGRWEPDIIGVVQSALAAVVLERSRRLTVYLEAVANATEAADGAVLDAVQRAMEAVSARVNHRGRGDGGDSGEDAQQSSSSTSSAAGGAATVAEDMEGDYPASLDVEYVDIGANVGAFLLHFWRHGYPVTAFEALPYNMQLLSTSLCLNGLREPAHHHDAAVRSTRTSGPPVAVHHTALGKERDLKCVMMSEEQNFGDTWISCNRTHVESTSEFPFQKYRKRGYVTMTTLDSLFVPGGEHSVMDHRAKAREIAVQEALQSLGVTSDAAVAKLRELEAADVIPEHSRLPEEFLTKDYVWKMDVEGHEVAVMEGATAVLADPLLRPRVVVSEVWLSLNVTRFVELMIPNGYVGWSLAFRVRIHHKTSLRNYNRMRGGQDTIVWVEERWEGIIIPRLFARRVAASKTGRGGGGVHADAAPGSMLDRERRQERRQGDGKTGSSSSRWYGRGEDPRALG